MVQHEVEWKHLCKQRNLDNEIIRSVVDHHRRWRLEQQQQQQVTPNCGADTPIKMTAFLCADFTWSNGCSEGDRDYVTEDG